MSASDHVISCKASCKACPVDPGCTTNISPTHTQPTPRTKFSTLGDDQRGKGGWARAVFDVYSSLPSGDTTAQTADFPNRKAVAIWRAELMPDMWPEDSNSMVKGFTAMLEEWPLARSQELYEACLKVRESKL